MNQSESFAQPKLSQQTHHGEMGVWTETHYQLYPDWQTYWDIFVSQIRSQLQVISAKLTESQQNSYRQYLTDLYYSLGEYVYSGKYLYFSQYQQLLHHYRTIVNPEGANIFDRQNTSKKMIQENTQTLMNPEEKQVKEINNEKKNVQSIGQDKGEIIEKLENTKWDEVKYPKFEELKKSNVNMIFIGHVDAGKSTLSGRILKNLGLIDKSELKKEQVKKGDTKSTLNSIWTDFYEDEKIRGKTLECSKTLVSLSRRRYTLFDAPGHSNYVPSMIHGACQADLAVLIISAKKGEFEAGFTKSGQTKEHAMLAKSLGVTNMLCVVTKMETVGWDQGRFNEIRKEVSKYLRVSCGYDQVGFIPVDSVADVNIDKKNQKVCQWYKGETLLDALENTEVPTRSSTEPLRIPIVDKFIEQKNLFVFGKIESGVITEEQTVTLLPNKTTFTIKQIFNARDERLPYAPAGENVKIRVKGIEQKDIERGNMICDNKNFCQVCEQFQARLTILELPNSKIISSGYQSVIHLHATVNEAEITSIKPVQVSNSKATFLRSGETGIVRIQVKEAVCLEKFEKMEGLGRFTLRDEGKTIGYGQVLRIRPIKKTIQKQNKKNERENVEPMTQLIQGKIKKNPFLKTKKNN